MSKHLKKASLFLAVSAGLGGYASVHADTPITSFTPGDLVVLRAGDATNPISGSTVTVGAYLDEYSPGGAYVGTIAAPQSVSGSNNALTLTSGNDFISSGTSYSGEHEGILTLSENGQWLSFGGYNTSPTTVSSGAGVSNVTLGEISQNVSTLNTSTLLAPNTVRGVTTLNGTQFWTTDGPAGSGLEYVGATGANANSSTTVVNASWNARAVATLNNNLIVGSGSSSLGTHGIWQVGTPGTLPQTASTAKALLTDTSAQDGTDFIFADEPGDSNLYQGEYNVMYTVGGASASQTINKYQYNGSGFSLVNSVPMTTLIGSNQLLIGVTDVVSGDNVDVYFTTTSGLYELVDSDSATALLPTPSPATDYLTALDTASSGEELYGVALAPSAAVPEPASLGLLAVAGVGLISRRRRRAE